VGTVKEVRQRPLAPARNSHQHSTHSGNCARTPQGSSRAGPGDRGGAVRGRVGHMRPVGVGGDTVGWWRILRIE
jgi:hypothetical protein